ncbi:adenosylcobinamide-GDP ribazoletransferase [Sphaerotilus sp.]|uniref:adenosylcobinamide-GDP ribazoletransferase n=1 Tax=Sphaerotilus sp. TaxID=2093942 RepID=UPI002ACD8174|nr:adenosylcobinamide-GDP ribazoletransferase [Sphaerotilus sp.]MDZ7855792.1 adenosylcobinamide-GDP ribazoletransferase [Sphaerotilus sp.]
MVHELRLFLVALQFLTRLPIPAWVSQDDGFDPRWLNACVRYFPLVGVLVGACGAAMLALASLWWPPLVAASLAVAATAWVTGAFHEDGLADTFDALGGNVPRERALVIMKDSRIGTYGAVALVFGLGLRVMLLASLAQRDPLHACLVMIGSHALGRAAAVGLMARLPYAGDAEHAKAKALATAVPRGSVVAAMGWALLLIAALMAAGQLTGAGDPGWVFRWPLAALSCVIVVRLLRRWLARRLGGYTGDTLGAAEQLSEIAVLLVLAGG